MAKASVVSRNFVLLDDDNDKDDDYDDKDDDYDDKDDDDDNNDH